jgi:Starch-binding associating with outer membrane
MKIKYIIALSAVITIAAASCKKEAFNINKDPNNANDSTIVYNLILASAENNTARIVARNWGWLENYLSVWARSGTYAPNVQEETYQLTTGFQNQIWDGIYDNNYDYQAMQNAATKAGASFYVGIAKIMKAHNYGILIDIYNNAPISEALKGGANVTPKYDKAADGYKTLLSELNAAIVDINAADVTATGPNKSIATDDIIYGSKLYPGTTIAAMKTRWVKLANTMKLRLLVHLMGGGVDGGTSTVVGTPATVVAGFDIAGEFAKIVATGAGYLETGIDAQAQPGYQADKGNPFYNAYVLDNTATKPGNADFYKANEWGLGYFNWNGDLRRSKTYTTVPGTTNYRGVKYGLPSVTSNAFATLSGIGAGIYRGADQPQWIMTACESYFLQAEAVARGFSIGGSAGTANALLNLGITESFKMLGLTAADAASYISGNATYADVDYVANAQPGVGKAKGGIFTIISQKWFALGSIVPYEVWTDYRRVDFSSTVKHFVYGSSVDYQPGPALSVSPFISGVTEIPSRLLYPTNEYNYNPTNVNGEGNINIFTSKIFWDRN